MDTSTEIHSTSTLSHRQRMIRLLSVGLIAVALCGVFLISWSSTMAQSNVVNSFRPAAQNLPQAVVTPNIVAVAVGGAQECLWVCGEYFDKYACALDSGGRVKCWGGNGLGQLGFSYFHGWRDSPVDVSGLTEGVITLKAGYAHTCALMMSGAVKCWGTNYFGERGNDIRNPTSEPIPNPVIGLTGKVSFLAAGSWHYCAVVNGSAQCWGWNAGGQLGDGTTIDHYTPTTVIGLNGNVTALAAGRVHTCALTDVGEVQCWGSYGPTYTFPPETVTGLGKGVIAIAAGQYHTCALMRNGGVKCWGDNRYGQLGDGTYGNPHTTPVDVTGLNQEVIAIAAGGYHTCAITSSGGAKCWGGNEYGEIGNGTTSITQPIPSDVVGLASGVTSIAPGYFHTCATTLTGLKCWGDGYGSTPVGVPWVAGQATANISSGGGILTSTVDNTTYLFVANTFSDTATVTHTIPFLENLPTSSERFNIGHAFEATAALSGTDQALEPSQPFTITVQYSTTERKAAIENTLALYRWEGAQWLKEPSSVVDPASHTVTAMPDHLGLWAVLGDTYRVWLPLIGQSYQPNEGVPLTFDPANDTQPALSPDGQTVIFLSDRTGQTDIFRASTTGSPATNLSHTPLAQEDTPVYSPDGTKIAFASDRSGDWDIYLMDADGTNVQRVIGYTGTDELQPAFTPDGNSLLFSSDVISGNWDIYSATLGSDSSSWVRLTTDPALDRFPSISADGTTIAFRSERDGNSEIYVMDANGAHQRRVTNEPAFDGYPSITPDGSGVVFTSWRSGTPQVYSMNLGGTGLITWTTRPGWEADHPRLSSDGRRLVYAARSISGTFDIFTRPFVSGANPLITSNAVQHSPQA